MVLGLASCLGRVEIEFSDGLTATRIVIVGEFLSLQGGFRVEIALIYFIACETFITFLALKIQGADNEFPIEWLPLNFFLISQEEYEFIQIPILVNDVLLHGLAMCINENLSIGAHLPFALILCKKSAAINTS